ncbi:hypothetical protein HU200_036134 [Digitaria exilis]|uniref:SHSP domain-containing protein n=1 Tax=Digitaria exilis TaxID=1010633 RepID=A0A835ENX2_9POAL|nr:hypothetical protein HU200_036134 [Digitaria exilis]
MAQDLAGGVVAELQELPEVEGLAAQQSAVDGLERQLLLASTKKEKLEVFIEDQVLLTIRYKDDGIDKNSPASGLDVRLLMPLGYVAKKVKAAIVPDGWLQITIAKPKAQKPEKIQISE